MTNHMSHYLIFQNYKKDNFTVKTEKILSLETFEPTDMSYSFIWITKVYKNTFSNFALYIHGAEWSNAKDGNEYGPVLI